jgi:thioredoxin reductase (NADPH)
MQLDKEVIIIGGGAAGLTAAQYSARSNLSTLVIEELATGGQALIIDRLENYPGFPEPINGMEFSQRMEEQAKRFGAEIVGATVTGLRKAAHYFEIETTRGVLTSHVVILATGAKHKTLDIPGELEFTGRGVSYCATCDGPFFKNRKILVVGGGDAACDEGTFLSGLTEKVTVVHRRDRFRAQRSIAERVLHNPHIEARFSTIVKEIKGDTKVRSVVLVDLNTGKEYEEEFDAVFVFIGSIPQTQLVPDVPKDEGGYVITNARMETSVPGLYCVGDVRNTPFRQLVTVAADGAVAAHCAAQYIDELRGEGYR